MCNIEIQMTFTVCQFYGIFLREYAKGCFVEKVSYLVDLVDSKLNPILNSENMP